MSDESINLLDESTLNPNEYQVLVAPVLEVTTDMSAKRGDPTMYNDLPAMLALMALVRTLVDCYLEDWGELGHASPRDVLEQAPLGAATMVLKEAGLTPEAMQDCQQALVAATDMLVKDGIIGSHEAITRDAWQLLVKDERRKAQELLRRATFGLIMSIEAWEAQREQQSAPTTH